MDILIHRFVAKLKVKVEIIKIRLATDYPLPLNSVIQRTKMFY